MKYNVGDRVRIKSLDWYNENKDENGNIVFSSKVTHFSWRENVRTVFTKDMAKFCGKVVTIEIVWTVNYSIVEGTHRDYFTDEMIEGLVEEEAKSHNNMCKQLIDEMNPNVEVNVKTPKFKIGDRVITDTNMKGKIIDVVEEGWYRVDFDDYNGISQPNGVVPEENMTIMTKETKPEPKFKVGDIIISDVFTTNDDKGWKVIDVERTGYKLMSVNNSDLICGMDFKNEHYYKLVEEEMKSEDGLLDEYEELTDRAFKGGYEKCQSDIELNGFQLPEGYIFKDENGNEILTNKIILEKKKKEYPKTFLECCDVLNIGNLIERGVKGYKAELFDTLQKLYICRDAYWKLYGEEMGLGKPWESDNDYSSPPKYIISCYFGDIIKEKYCGQYNRLLSFPTEEMRDAFYENFKKDIEKCKDLL